MIDPSSAAPSPLGGTLLSQLAFRGHYGTLTPLSPVDDASPLAPLSYVIETLPLEEWPLEWLEPKSACGFSWSMLDVEVFLSRTTVVRNPASPYGFCRMWDGAKSRGQGNQQWYGSFYTQGKTVRAHKFSAIAILGLRPEIGHHLDHECHNTLCVSCLRVLSKQENEALIRRPKKHHLDLARYCNLTPAEVMQLPEDRLPALIRLMKVGKLIEQGCRVPGVMVDGPRKRGTH